MNKITPSLWFDHQAEEAAEYYTSIVKNSKIKNISRYGEEGPGQPGTVMTILFEIGGQEFMAINGGPVFSFTPAISFMINCETQDEVDELWEKLSEGGEKQQCGWLVDKYGVSWQIVPTELHAMLSDSDEERKRRVSKAVLAMQKLDIGLLREAYHQG